MNRKKRLAKLNYDTLVEEFEDYTPNKSVD